MPANIAAAPICAAGSDLPADARQSLIDDGMCAERYQA